MGFKIESQLELHLMRQGPALTQICCILNKKWFKKNSRNTAKKKANS